MTLDSFEDGIGGLQFEEVSRRKKQNNDICLVFHWLETLILATRASCLPVACPTGE